MLYKLISIFLMISFYAFYIAKIITQNKQNIKTNQMGKGIKEKRVLFIERIMRIATVLIVIVEVFSIFISKIEYTDVIKIIGCFTGFIAVFIFGIATITMKNIWRVGIPEEKTAIITEGIYSISRNPAFLGFDLLYISILLINFNILLLVISLWAIIMLHLQIIQEEKWLEKTFKEEYLNYKLEVNRYIGKR